LHLHGGLQWLLEAVNVFSHDFGKGVSMVFGVAGAMVFRRLKPHFADAL
jgi:hypothetical protein